MNLDQAIREASQRVSDRINERADRIRIAQRFAWEHQRRSAGQRWRYLAESILKGKRS